MVNTLWMKLVLGNVAADLALFASLYLAKTDNLRQLAGLVGFASYFGKPFFFL